MLVEFKQGRVVLSLKNKKVVVIVAHADDFEFMCGGTISKYSKLINSNQMSLEIVVVSSRMLNTGETLAETEGYQKCSLSKLNTDFSKVKVQNFNYRSRFVPNSEDDLRLDLKNKIVDLPDIIITHSPNDTNQDHVSVFNQVIRVFKGKNILCGRVLNSSYRFQPNLHICLNKSDMSNKINALKCYEKESKKRYFSYDLIMSEAIVSSVSSEGCDYSESFEIYNLNSNECY